MGQFSAGAINNGVPSFSNSLTVKGVGRHSKYLSLIKKVFALTAFALS